LPLKRKRRKQLRNLQREKVKGNRLKRRSHLPKERKVKRIRSQNQ
jgi:hypothetical protein